ncbi:F-actin-monooxygenase MICAL3-like isoform X9 [Mobula birostris]|uniref:F-actin-monooxygenase MICAL3-like isoform X9 n=1 Tax=Mobula birostris TaxID=1983395 RepID=UPI003B28AC17
MGDGGTSSIEQSHIHFDRFIQATTCKGTFKGFQELCEILDVSNLDFPYFYTKLKSKLNYWKAKALFAKLDKRGSHKDYKKNTACANIKCLVIGAGPCGLRTAIELMFLGAKVIIVEKRDTFSRNNVLHLWPYTIQDLRNLGAKKIYGKFCAGAIDHISIRQLQLVLLKIALILGTEIHLNVEFRGLLPPRGLKNPNLGWRADIDPPSNKVAQFEFDVVIGADGRRNTLEGFRRKEFRGKLAIAITANFINRHTREEARVEEISGVAFIFNQKFFQDLREATGVDLENIVYYKDDTHYFVMTAKKQSLLEKGVILQDFQDTEKLLSRNNVNQDALLNYAREAADFSTNHKLPQLDFAMNHYGQPDVAMFDFTCMYASENASLVREESGKRLLVNLVGDSLLEPFWPMGTGIARGFLAAFDAAWMVRSFAQGTPPLNVLAERESIYRLLPQTTPQNISKDFNLFSIDPVTRYPKVNIHVLDPNQVRHLYITGDQKVIPTAEPAAGSRSPRTKQSDSLARSNKLLAWCQKQTQGYKNVNVVDLTTSWKSGLALCAILHRYRPDLIDFQQLNEKNVEANNQLAFDVAEREFGISPIMTGKEMASVGEPDKLSMVMYLLQFYEMLKDTTPEEYLLGFHDKSNVSASTKSPIAFFSRLGQNITRKWTPKEDIGRESVSTPTEKQGLARRATMMNPTGRKEERDMHQRGNIKTITDKLLSKSEVNVGGLKSQRCISRYTGGVSGLAEQIASKLQRHTEPKPRIDRRELQSIRRKEFPSEIGGSDVCYFCGKRVYVMERLSAEGKFFHRGCFKCDYCGETLRLSTYAYNPENGKFYCKPHYRLAGREARKRPATPPAAAQEKVFAPPLPTINPDGQPSPKEPHAEGAAEPWQAKRLRGTPERIELENIRVSLEREEDLQEVPEETLAEHNLSNALLQTGQEPSSSCSSSEYEMEEDEEEGEDEEVEEVQEEEEKGKEGAVAPSVDGLPWGKAAEIHQMLKDRPEEDTEAESEDEQKSESSYASNAPPFRSEAVRAWLDSLTGEKQMNVELSPDEEEEEENNSSLEDDIASDAEAESNLVSYTHELEQLVRKKEEACGEVLSPDGYIPTHPVLSRSNTDPQVSSLNFLRNQPEVSKLNSIVEPYCSERREEQSSKLASSLSNLSPVRLQPLFFPELTSPCSPVRSQPAATPAAQSPATPAICCQPLTSPEAASPITTQSPVKSQPVPTILTSTPIAEPGRDKKSSATSPVQGEEKPAAKDPVGEFWLRSSEMRKSLRVGAPERTSGSETSFTLSTTGSASPQSFTPEELFEEHPASSPPPSGAPSIPSVEEQVVPSLTPSPSAVIEPKSSFSGQRDLTSTSGLGLNGSLSNTRTAASESLNNSDTMLTPPSSPPPPPPANEEPATLRRRKPRDTKKRPAEQGFAQESPGQQESTPAPRSVRKSLAESIDEIPFADDVEDTFDERTPETSLQDTLGQERPARLHPIQSMKVGEAVPTAAKRRPLTEISPEAKEVAKERMKAREKSVKSQALRDAMARELRKMKEMEAVEEASARPQRAQDTGTESAPLSSAGLINGHEQQEAVVDSLPCPVLVPAPALDGSHEGSVASSESSSGKTKKRASLFSPRKSKKEKKSKAENSLTEELTKPRSIWRSVFSSYRKDRKKKEEKACLGSPSNSNTTNSGTKRSTDILRTAVELQLRQHLSFSEDSDLSSDDILERTSQRSRREKPYTEEELNSKLTRRVQKAARRQAKQEELKRLHRAQIIQRQLEQVEEKQRQLEERGVAVEKALRGEAVEALVGAPRRRPLSFCHCCTHDRGMGKKDDPRLMQEWFKLVQEKNRLVRYESELMIFARELELEDCQSRLQQELRERMAIDDNLKNSEELLEERRILNEMLEVVEQRDALVALLEEQRLREKEEDKDLEAVMLSKSYNLNWS